MTYYNRETQVRNRLNAMNDVYSFVNAIMPELTAFKKANGIRVRKDNTLFRKDKEALDAIIDKHRKFTDVREKNLVLPYEHIRFFYRHYEYSETLTIEFSLAYRIGSDTVNYFKHTATIKENLEPITLIDVDAKLKELEGYDKLKEECQAMQSNLRSLELTLFGR